MAAAGLLLVGLFALHATWAPPWVAALGAVAGLAAAPWPGALSPWGEGEGLLALAFALPAVALLVGHASRSSAVAAGMLLAAAALAQPLLAAGMLLAAAVGRGRRGAPAGSSWPWPSRWRSRPPACGPWRGLSRCARSWPWLGRCGRPRSSRLPSGWLSRLSFPLALVRLADPRWRAGRLAASGLAVVGAALLVVRVHGWVASGQLPALTRDALARAAAGTRPLDALCAPEGARDWVPALAAREAGEPGPWIPTVYADEWAARTPRPCGARLEDFASSR